VCTRTVSGRIGKGLVLLAATTALLAGSAWSQDGSKALNIFQQLLVRPGAANPAPAGVPGVPAGAAGVLGNALSGSSTAAATSGGTGQAIDLVGLLSQSTETIDEPREVAIGRQLAAVLLGSKPLHPDMALQRYVNQLGRWISLHSPRPDLGWTFAVLDDAGYNAFAAPGGYIFVTKGLVDRVADESELAGILAHEITHVVQRHHLQAMRKTARAGAITQVIGSQLNNNLGGALSAQLLSLGRNLYAKGLDQEDEFEADRLGVALAARAGFDPYGLVAVLQQLRTATPDNPVFTLSLSTHPAPQLRLDQVELAMGNRLDALTGKAAITVPQRMDLLAQTEQRRTAATAAAAAASARPAAASPAAATRATTKAPAKPARAPAPSKKP
jgi:predicted Zn-dependent protease